MVLLQKDREAYSEKHHDRHMVLGALDDLGLQVLVMELDCTPRTPEVFLNGEDEHSHGGMERLD